MNKLSTSSFTSDELAGLTAPEISQLRALLRVMRYDGNEKALVIDTDRARWLCRKLLRFQTVN